MAILLFLTPVGVTKVSLPCPATVLPLFTANSFEGNLDRFLVMELNAAPVIASFCWWPAIAGGIRRAV